MYSAYFHQYEPRKPSKMDNYLMIVEFFQNLIKKWSVFSKTSTDSVQALHSSLVFDWEASQPLGTS